MDPMTPHRIQRRRTKGWRMPEGAIYVGRPSRWGNDLLPTMLDLNDRPLGVERSVELYRLAVLRMVEDEPEPGWNAAWFAPLRGRDLACWCPLDQPCHADVLLELANEGDPMTPRDAIAELRELMVTLTEGCEPGPWHAMRSGADWWLENMAGDSMFPGLADVALMVNVLSDPNYTLLPTAEYDRLRGIVERLVSETRQVAQWPQDDDAAGVYLTVGLIEDARAALEAQGGPRG